MTEPPPLPPGRPRAPTVRSKLMLEVASELVGRPEWAHKQAKVELRVQGPNPWEIGLLASDGPDDAQLVLEGQADFAIINPATVIARAAERAGGAATDLASIATVPSYDQLGLAVASSYGISALEDLPGARPAMRVSLRGQRNHSVHVIVEDVLASVGVTMKDLVDWGGQILYHEGLPHTGERVTAMADRTIDAMFDEGIYNWVDLATDAEMVFLSMAETTLATLERAGYRRSVLTTSRFPQLATDVLTIDFSGFMVYTRSDAPDDLVEAFCASLDARSDRIPWQGGPSLPLAQMVSDAVDAPLPIPLHPAAAAYWRSASNLDSPAR